MKDKFTVKKKVTKTVIAEEEVILNFQQFIGYNVMMLRKGKNLSQDELSEKLGIVRTSVVNIEAGRQNLSVKRLRQLCDIFKCDSFKILKF